MIPKRVKQFYTNVTDFMSVEDYEYVKSILNNVEFDLFNRLLKSEQKHSVRIAREIEYIINYGLTDNEDIILNKNILVKAALLHDIGKGEYGLNIVKKSEKVQCYYNHSEYSYDILKELIKDELLLDIVKNHHSNTESEIIKFYQEIDDRN